ncbi:MAG: hypothetical protein PHD37_00985 [Gallionellaceae bacterium]|nr:hypothetical protein [Gallionellaceae bacterium]
MAETNGSILELEYALRTIENNATLAQEIRELCFEAINSDGDTQALLISAVASLAGVLGFSADMAAEKLGGFSSVQVGGPQEWLFSPVHLEALKKLNERECTDGDQ